MKLSKRISEIPPSGTFKVLALSKKLEREGKEIIHLDVGEPDFDTPEHIKEAAKDALARGMTKYTPSAGMFELREAIAKSFTERNIPTSPEEVLVTPGAKHAIFCAMITVLDPGDEVLIPSPCWTYDGIARVAGVKPTFIKTSKEDGFRLRADDVAEKITSRARMLVLNSPNNPTGAVLEKEDLVGLLDLAVDHDLWILADEIYDRFVYEGRHVSVISFPQVRERTVYINGFSKTYAMTGWRLGYSIAPNEITEKMIKVQQATTTCPPPFVQIAGVAALKGSQECVEKMLREYRKRRELIVRGLNSIDGIRCAKPAGAFYAFPNIEELGIGSSEFCERLLNDAGVATVPGSAFGPHGEGHVRFSYANSEKNIERALERMKESIEHWG